MAGSALRIWLSIFAVVPGSVAGLVLVTPPVGPAVQRSCPVTMQYGGQQYGDQYGQPQQQGYGQELPYGWTSGVDQGSGTTYYYNEMTGESQWDPPQSSTPQQGWHLVPRYLLEGKGRHLKTDYTLPLGGEQILGRYDIVDQLGQKLTVSRQQCVVQAGPDGSLALYSTGKPPTGWRTGPHEPWTWLQNGQSVMLDHGHKISLDQNNPMDAVFVCQQLGRAGAPQDQYQPYAPQEGGGYY